MLEQLTDKTDADENRKQLNLTKSASNPIVKCSRKIKYLGENPVRIMFSRPGLWTA